MQDNAFLKIASVSKLFGLVRGVDAVDFGIGRGEFFSILGPSGCGKTTLMRMIAGFETPTSGDIFIEGENVTRTPPYRRPVNMVFQNYAIFPHLTVAQNIAYGLRKDRLTAGELERRVSDALEMIQLQSYGGRKPTQLSGGQRQRVALARALIKRPKVLLLDEPLGALDKKLREQMQLELRQLQRTVGITFVFVTHDQEEALTMSDRVAVMNAGRVEEIGTPSELYARPQTKFVAGFLGSMNFLPARVTAIRGEEIRLESASAGELIAAIGQGKYAVGQSVEVGIRPENITLSNAKPDSGHNAFQSRVETLSFVGDRTFVHVVAQAGGEKLIAAQQNIQGVQASPSPGSDIWMSAAKSSLVILPVAGA